MQKRVIVIENTLDPERWEIHDTESILQFCVERFEKWPETARIYNGEIAECFDVTPCDEYQVNELEAKDGPFYIVVYPKSPIFFAIAVIAAAATAAVAYLLMPKVPDVSDRNITQGSSNNELADRTNTQRLNGRIPDIFGNVRSTPDLIMPTYKIFEGNVEQEISYMCIGKGAYEVWDIRDDDTLISNIQGASVEVYAPFTSPRSGDAPQMRVGDPISASVKVVKRMTGVNGQTLRAPNSDVVRADSGVRFEYPNAIVLDSGIGAGMDRRFDIFSAGQTITLQRAVRVGARAGGGADVTVNLNGTYVIANAFAYRITLVNPATINSDWNQIDNMVGDATPYGAAAVEDNINKAVGPFIIDRDDTNELVFNFVALSGLYKDNSERQYKVDVDINIGVTPVNSAGTPTGPEVVYPMTVNGSSANRDLVGKTQRITFDPPIGRCRVRAWRVTDTDYAFDGSVVDEVKWRDCYAMAAPGRNRFGDVTTVLSKTVATAGALALKERKLNMQVVRKVNQRIAGTDTFDTALVPSRNAADIFCWICRDRKIGNRPLSQIDVSGIYNAFAQIQAYFGTFEAITFDYTFDSDNISFEETASAIASACFSSAYRMGNVIKVSPELETNLSRLLINHRNKIPGSEKRTVSFGYVGDNDGVEYEYVSPKDDAVMTIYRPADQSARNPKKVKSVGIRGELKAHFHINRIWNKIQYQNTTVECDVTQEAAFLTHMDRILIADNTRPDTYDGEVVSQSGLVVTLSQALPDVNLAADYVFMVQHVDGSVERLDIVTRTDPYSVQLTAAPRLPLAVNDALFAKATYWFVKKAETRPVAFLLSEKDTSDNFVFKVQAINYDARYYANDKDYANGVIDANANPL